jgi:hypothetical protein
MPLAHRENSLVVAALWDEGKITDEENSYLGQRVQSPRSKKTLIGKRKREDYRCSPRTFEGVVCHDMH